MRCECCGSKYECDCANINYDAIQLRATLEELQELRDLVKEANLHVKNALSEYGAETDYNNQAHAVWWLKKAEKYTKEER